MSAALDTPVAQRFWCCDRERPGDRLVFAALRAWRAPILAGRFEITPHAKLRMSEYGIGLEQLRATVRDGRIIPNSRVHTGDTIYGGFLADGLRVMVVVSALAPRGVNFSDLVPAVRTVYRTEPGEPAPFAVPLGELARSATARG